MYITLPQFSLLGGLFGNKKTFVKESNASEKAIPVAAQSLSIDQLVEDHYDYLFRYAHRYFRSSDKAQDLVQETFLAALTAIKRFEGQSSPRTWLTSILRHKIMDYLRIKDREQPVDLAGLDQEQLTKLFDEAEHWRKETGPLLWGAQPDSALKQRQFFSALEECLSKLPGRVRQIFLLRELDECAREEISEKLDISSSNVGVILHRARLSLQRCLQVNWFQEPVKGSKS